MDHDEAQSKPFQTGPEPAVPMSGDDAGPKRIGHAGIFKPCTPPLTFLLSQSDTATVMVPVDSAPTDNPVLVACATVPS